MPPLVIHYFLHCFLTRSWSWFESKIKVKGQRSSLAAILRFEEYNVHNRTWTHEQKDWAIEKGSILCRILLFPAQQDINQSAPKKIKSYCYFSEPTTNLNYELEQYDKTTSAFRKCRMPVGSREGFYPHSKGLYHRIISQ